MKNATKSPETTVSPERHLHPSPCNLLGSGPGSVDDRKEQDGKGFARVRDLWLRNKQQAAAQGSVLDPISLV